MPTPDTRSGVLDAAKEALIESGFARLSTRRIAETAGVPLSQIHYHFGSKHQLVLAVLEQENRTLLERQSAMYGTDQPLWKQWEQACDFLDEDIASGYVRVLQEMLAAGWSDPEIALAVRSYLDGWYSLLHRVAESAGWRMGTPGPFEPGHVAALITAVFLGAESMILLGFEEGRTREALRGVGELIRQVEEGGSDASPDT